jgi:hypothetical protein
MRLARPVYESMPPLYASIGALGLLIAYLDPEGPRTMVAFGIGLLMEIAALTVFLRRQDYRAKVREYAGGLVDLPSLDLPPR